MPVQVGGLNHKVAPLELRERLAFSSTELKNRLDPGDLPGGVDELVILSTCNRTEIYVCGEDSVSLRSSLEGMLSAKRGEAVSFEDKNYYTFGEAMAARHLFRVAAGLDSMVLGEAQILGQVREAYRLAQEGRTAGRVLSRLFQQAVRTGKRARTETAISIGAVSVSSVAVDLARKIFGKLDGRQALVLGAGETSELTLSLLVDQGVESVLVANRTYRRAVELALKYHGTAVNYDELYDYLPQADIVISSTSAPHFILDVERSGRSLAERKRPIFLIDLAVPRDIDPRLAEYESCFLYNIDDLQNVVQANVQERCSQVGLVEEIVEAECLEFMNWCESLAMTPLIQSLHDQMNSLREKEVGKVLGKLKHLSESDRQLVESFSVQMLNKFLHNPTSRIKSDPGALSKMDPAQLIRFLFGLDNGSRDDRQ